MLMTLLTAGAIHVEGNGSSQAANLALGVYELRLPGANWGLVFDIPGYAVEAEQTRRDRSGVMMRALNNGTGMIISAFLEREKQSATAHACREIYWTRSLNSPSEKSNVRTFEADSMAMGEYFNTSFQGQRIMQKHVHVYMGVGEVCVDIHLSKVLYKDSDEPLFSSVINSVRVKN